MKLAWCTDIHLNFLEADELTQFCRGLAESGADAVVVTGDITEAPYLAEHLGALERALARPIYFVLGNHDYYRGSIPRVRAEVRDICARSAFLRWMPSAGVVALGPGTALVGHDGWADGRFGDWAGSRVMLNDYLHIDELAYLPKSTRLARLKELADEAARYLRGAVRDALERFAHVVVATHVPPFREACWHEGTVSDDAWLPHFASRAVGEALLEVMSRHADRRMTVLCGHTHSGGVVEVLPNLTVRTGAAKYGAPTVEQILEL